MFSVLFSSDLDNQTQYSVNSLIKITNCRGKRACIFCILFIILFDTNCIVDFDNDSEDILLEPPSKIWIQMEEWLSIF